MAYRTHTSTQVIVAANDTDYQSDKALVQLRYGVGGEYYGNCTFEFDDANKTITLTRVNTEYIPV